MKINDFFYEEKTRLDPACWTGKKIGTPKTKVKGGIRVNNCVPAESVAEELSIKHQRDHSTQHYPDTSNSLATRSVGMAELPNVYKTADGHPTVRGRFHGKAAQTRVNPTITPTSVNRKDSSGPIPAFLKKGVAEGYSLKKTNVNKYMEPGDPDEYTQDINIKDTDFEIINNKTGQVVGTASWTTNDYFGPGALKITMKNGATRWLDIWEREKGNPQTAFNRFVKDPKTAKKYKEQGVVEAFPNPGSGSTGSSKEDKRIAAALRKKHIPTTPNDKKKGVAEGSEQEYKIYFVIPEHEDYPDRHEPTERTIVLANSPGEAARKFKAETPEAYIKDIIPLGQPGVAEGISDLLNQDPKSPKFNDHPGPSKTKYSGSIPTPYEKGRLDAHRKMPYNNIHKNGQDAEDYKTGYGHVKSRQQGVAEGFNGEYDDEAGMAQTNLHTIARAAQGLLDTINDHENLPEWVQEKIAKVEDMMVTAWDYLESQEEQGIDPEIESMYEAMHQTVCEMAAKYRVSEDLVWESFEALDDHMLYETAAWRRKEGKSAKGGLNAKGVASYRRENPGSKLQTAVTTKPSKLKPGSKAAKRRKSFCARMSGVKGPAKKPNGKPTRKTLALRKWNC